LGISAGIFSKDQLSGNAGSTHIILRIMYTITSPFGSLDKSTGGSHFAK
jgi:hypothetical protein